MATDLLTIFAATIFVWFCLYAARHALRKLAGVVLPSWVTPAALALTLVGTSIWTEYSWYDRTRGALPDSVTVFGQGQTATGLRPWTYLRPFTSRFIAVDRAALRGSAAQPTLVQGEMWLIERWKPIGRVPAVWDCANQARADLFGPARLAPDGTVTGTTWVTLGSDDPGLRAACMS